MYDLIIFDCDGVMFDSRKANEAFYNAILEHFGLPEMDEASLPVVHMATGEDSLRHLIPDPDLFAQANRHRLGMDYSPFYPLMQMEPDLTAVLHRLRRDRQTAVCTNRSNTIHRLLEVFSLTDLFDTVVSSLDVERPKPAPDMVFETLKRLNARPGSSLFVGDSISDQKAAMGANTPFAAFRSPELEADYHIDSLSQILDLV